MSGEVKLASCPVRWCSKSKPKLMQGGFRNGSFVVRCQTCGCETPQFYGANKAIATWNTRPTVVTDEVVDIPREPTDAMIEAGAATPGMKAASDAMVMHQARGYGFDADAFNEGSPLHQAWRAMWDAAMSSEEGE
jgi:hypothetical protein